MKTVNIVTPFRTSLYMVDDVEHDILDQVLKMRDEDEGLKISNKGGWQSKSLRYEDTDWIKPLMYDIKDVIQMLYTGHGIDKEPSLVNYWVNINSKHNYNTTHTHPYSMFSAVWYLQAPTDCGNIVFERPDSYNEYILTDRITESNTATWIVTPKKYKMIFFPSYLPHHVEMNNSDEDRVSVAFNFGTLK